MIKISVGKLLGLLVLAGFIGAAIGNHIKTQDALKGQAQYFQSEIGKKVDKQRRLDEQQFFGN